MSLNNVMNDAASTDNKKKLTERTYRLSKSLNYWAQIPEIKENLDQLSESKKLNLACNLNLQAAYMKKYREQTSQSFQGMTPENVLRLVRLSLPNAVRGDIFTDFAMETARDSIKYVRPVYSKTQNGNELVDKTDTFSRLYADPEDTYNDFNDPEARKAIYETTEDRINQELAIGVANTETAGSVIVTFKSLTDAEIKEAADAYSADRTDANKATFEAAKASKKWGYKGEKFIAGYTEVYYEKQVNVIAQEDKRTGKFFINPDYADKVTSITTSKDSDGAVIVTVVLTGTTTTDADTNEETTTYALDASKVKVHARYDSEDDFVGDYLGEVEIRMSEYFFRPRPTSIGVTWSTLMEINLDASFNLSAEEYLVSTAAQAIKVALDYKAIRLAYAAASTNPSAYHITFDAGYATVGVGTNVNGTKDSYLSNSMTFLSAISTVGDAMLNEMNRGGVSRLVAGPSAGTYMMLMPAFSATNGEMFGEGAHQVGEVAKIPLYKVPADIIPTNKVLCVWKNPNNEADIAVAFGTLVPFFSTGTIQRKNFYKEAGLSTFGDWHVIEKRYLATITIENLKDTTN